MITIRHRITGERQFVDSMKGVDRSWKETGEPVPEDLGAVAYVVRNDELVPASDLKEQQWATVKAGRDAARFGLVETPLGVVQADPASRAAIIAAAQSAEVALRRGEDFSIIWTMADNSRVSLDAEAMGSLAMAVTAWSDKVQRRGEALRQQIEDTLSDSEVRAVVWSMAKEGGK